MARDSATGPDAWRVSDLCRGLRLSEGRLVTRDGFGYTGGRKGIDVENGIIRPHGESPGILATPSSASAVPPSRFSRGRFQPWPHLGELCWRASISTPTPGVNRWYLSTAWPSRPRVG